MTGLPYGLLYLFGRDGIDEGKERGDIAGRTLVQERLADVQGEGLPIVAGHTELSFQLFLGSLQLSFSQWFLYEMGYFCLYQSLTPVNIFRVTTII